MSVTDRILGEAGEWQRAVRRRQLLDRWVWVNPKKAYNYALNVIKGRWPEGEATIAKHPMWAYLYAKNVIGGRWPEVEPTIAKDPGSAVLYAKDVIKGRWSEGEHAIAKDPYLAHKYAIDVIKGRFPEGEEAIAIGWKATGWNSGWRNRYLKEFPDAGDDWILNGWLDWLDT